ALHHFKRGNVGVLIATDIAARGLDIVGLHTVVNFDLPRSTLDYTHRIGRTGRAGESGRAVSFIDHDTADHFRLIEQRTQMQLPRQQVPGFELKGEAKPRSKGAAPTKGKRKSKKDKLREAAARAAGAEATPAVPTEPR
ncbi:MAG: helicase-related protein, partial [Myxococcota bacterium]